MNDDAIDYKALLKKYMQHVMDSGCSTYVCYILSDGQTDQGYPFTPIEVAALRKMNDEVRDE